MISTITAEKISTSVDPPAHSSFVDGSEQADNMDSRSSSLSELDDGTEERVEASIKDPAELDEVENDSEAETELLTPRKPNSYNPDANGSHTIEKSPSKLTQEVILDTRTPDRAESATEDVLPSSSNISVHASSPLPTHLTDSMDQIDQETESQTRKRKRSTSMVSSLSEMDIPLAKRSHSSKLESVAPTSPIDDTIVPDVDEQAEIPEDEAPKEDALVNGTTLEDDESVAPPVEQSAPLRGRWPGGKRGKGKRKGGRRPNNYVPDNEVVGEPSDVVAEDGVDQADAEAEEESSSVDGERESL
jgi:hypothetical protein